MDKIGPGLNSDILFKQMESNRVLKGGINNLPESSGEDGQVGGVLANFGTLLKNEMNKINTLQSQADQAIQTYAVGGPIDLHNVILATEKADMALQLAMQVRNKLVQAYQEVSRMQV